jgi:pyochelin synthetase
MSQPVEQLVAELTELGVTIWADGGQLRFRAPTGLMTEERRATLRARKDELVEYLRRAAEPAQAVPDPDGRYEPFPITEVQSAYMLGRGATFGYGGVACHGYGELTYPDLDPERMEAAWRALVARHDMLRAVIDLDGSQRVLPEVPAYRLAVADLRGQPPAEVVAAIAATRSEMDHRVFAPGTWPLFEARVTRHDGGAVMHMSIDFLIADFISIQVLLDELHHLYEHPDQPLPELEITFRDYLLAERRAREGDRYERDRAYWLDRLDELPPAPELPVRSDAAQAPPRFKRRAVVLDAPTWAALRRRAAAHDVSASTAVLAAYAEAIGAWSRHGRFTLDLTLLNRMPLHPQVNALVGDFTSVELLAVDTGLDAPFAERARATQARLWEDLDHRSFSGVAAMREIGRRHGPDAALFPIVFTSAIGLGDKTSAPEEPPYRMGYGISQTPQVWIDCQNIERGGELHTNWDVREGVLVDGVVDAMFDAYADLLRRLAESDEAWSEVRPCRLPAAQAATRAAVNATAAPVPAGLLHDRVVRQALRTPDRVAVVADRPVTYGELLGRAVAVADRLVAEGCRPGELVGIVMDRGWEQVVAVLGALLAGGAYVPVDTGQPSARRDGILARAGVRRVLTQRWLRDADWPEGVAVTAVDLVPPVAPRAVEPRVDPGDLAYVIHTSGSTGTPKGVMISHRAALNTVVDINTRFQVGADDAVLGLSNLGFDLSVYDIFGPLAVGGRLVVPAQDRRSDPSHWAELLARHRVTLWNSVPAQLQMLHDYLSTALPATNAPVEPLALRLAMLSGDWIPVALPDQIRTRIPGLRVVSLGGATEAAIWSIAYPIERVDPAWSSIPYGRPLTNQTFHVLDSALRPRPDWATGELYIGGVGVALGYLDDPEKTAARFVTHPETGERLYRTGDLGRYLPSGDIEFLGRDDLQVKIRGYRIELAEVEAALGACPGVGASAVVVDGDQPLERRLVGFLEPARRRAVPDRALAAELAAAANRAGDGTLAGLDRERYESFTRRLDRVALPAMVSALQASGLFLGEEGHTYPEVLRTARVAPRHERLVRRWLRALCAEKVLDCRDGTYRLAGTLSADELDRAWAAAAEVARPEDRVLLDYFRTSIDHLPALLRGEEDPLALLFPEGRMDVTRVLYEDAVFNRWVNAAVGAAVRRLADRRAGGPFRVLEIGAGGGGTTGAVLDALSGVEDVDYLCTDLSPFFLNQIQARFGERPGLRVAVYDIDADPREQGLAPNSFDVVVAGDVLHASTDVDRALSRLRELLVPGGWLVAAEMTRDHYQTMTSIELLIRLDGAAADFTDGRQGSESVFLDRERWASVLRDAGADLVTCEPEPDGFVAELGMCLLAARFKADREPVDTTVVTDHLRRRLPEYMVPPVLQVVDALPLTGNGKVDRKRLRGWLPRRTSSVVAGEGASAAANDLEQRLARIWAEALRVPEVGRADNLFALGGDSLVAAQIAGRLIDEVPEAREVFFDRLLRQVLEGPTVAQLAAYLAAEGADETPSASPRRAEVEGGSSLVPLAEGGSGGPAYLLVHDRDGGLDGYGPLAEALGAAGRTVLGAVDRTGGAEPDLERAAAGYARAVADVVPGPVHVVGVGPTAALAVEVGRALGDAGHPVDGVTLLGGYRPTAPAAGGWVAAVAAHEPSLYAGDITVVRAAGDGPWTGPEGLDPWTDLCLGDLRVVETAAATPEELASVPAVADRLLGRPATAAALEAA